MAAGNTKQQPPKIHWCFTYNNPPDPIDPIVQGLQKICKKFVFQQEIGENGTPHLQGYVHLRSKCRLSKLKSQYPTVHWEPTRSILGSIEYCSNESKRAPGGGIWKYGFPRSLNLIVELRPWQSELYAELQSPANDRTIYWRWDAAGGAGKTAFAKYLVGTDGINALYVGGKSADIKFAIVKHFELDNLNRDDLIVLWDIPRSSELYLSYAAIEEVKNGIFFSGKYESGGVIYNSPHVVCFANFEPNRGALSLDRWDVKCIDLE